MPAETSNASTKLRVIYIMGCGRSGSTVLDTLLGNHPDVASVGELHVLSGALAENEYCACREPIRRCPFWVEVMKQWHRETSLEEGEYVALQRKFEQVRYLGGFSWLQLLGNRIRESRSLRTYVNETTRLYEAIAEVSGTRIIVESSKVPVRAALLAHSQDLDLRLIHLVRDVRAVAWSRRKSFGQSLAAGIATKQPGRGAFHSCVHWLLVNLVSGQVRRRCAPNSTLLRYEDLAACSEQAFRTISSVANVDFHEVWSAVSRGDSMQVGHLFAGNRVRMSGPVQLKLDTEWERSMPIGDRRLTALLSHWLLRHYGYTHSGRAVLAE